MRQIVSFVCGGIGCLWVVRIFSREIEYEYSHMIELKLFFN